MAGLAGLLVGIAGSGSTTELEEAQAAAQSAETELADVEAELDGAEERVAELEEQEAELEDRIAEAESERDEAGETAREELAAEREEVLEEANAEAEEILAGAQGRTAALDEREAELEERAEELDVVEERQAANTFGNGVHVVGKDVAPGVYRTDGGGNCYWARLSGLGGDLGDVIANGLPDGPATIEISSSDAGFESSGCSDWTRAN